MLAEGVACWIPIPFFSIMADLTVMLVGFFVLFELSKWQTYLIVLLNFAVLFAAHYLLANYDSQSRSYGSRPGRRLPSLGPVSRSGLLFCSLTLRNLLSAVTYRKQPLSDFELGVPESRVIEKTATRAQGRRKPIVFYYITFRASISSVVTARGPSTDHTQPTLGSHEWPMPSLRCFLKLLNKRRRSNG